jgi:probable F420-dependent oxidoreductase
MKIRIGFGLGTRSITNDERFGPFVDDLERLRFDSLWLSERVGGEAPDPVVGMAYAAGRTKKLKFGTSVMVLPGRNPVLVAKSMATLDRLSGGRLLPAFGLGVADAHEQQAFGVERKERAAWFDEALPLIRRLWTEDRVDHDGPRFHLEGIGVLPKPVQQPVDVWLGGFAPSELRRVGRLGDGWLPSFIVPDEVRAGRKIIEETADAHGRAIDDEHYGVLVPYSLSDELPDSLVNIVRRRRPELDPAEMIPTGYAALRAQLEAFIEAGASKFVVLPAGEPQDWTSHLEELATELLPLQN